MLLRRPESSDRPGKDELEARQAQFEAKLAEERVGGVLPLPGFQLGHAEPCVTSELAPCSGCAHRQDATLLVLGLVATRVAELADLPHMPAQSATYVQDLRVASSWVRPKSSHLAAAAGSVFMASSSNSALLTCLSSPISSTRRCKPAATFRMTYWL